MRGKLKTAYRVGLAVAVLSGGVLLFATVRSILVIRAVERAVLRGDCDSAELQACVQLWSEFRWYRASASHHSSRLLGAAAQRSSLCLMRQLMSRGLDPQEPDALGRTPLHHCARASSLDGCRLLLDADVSVEPRDVLGCTPLQLAAGMGAVEVVNELLARGASVEPVDQAGFGALEYSVLSHKPSVVLALLAAGARPSGEFDEVSRAIDRLLEQEFPERDQVRRMLGR